MRNSLAVGRFAVLPVAITHHDALFRRQLDEFLGFLELVAGRVPPEAEKVEPSPKLVPGEAAMRADEAR